MKQDYAQILNEAFTAARGAVVGISDIGTCGMAAQIYKGAATMPDDWKPDERTIRLCMDNVPSALSVEAYKLTVNRLAALITKPDTAKALVEEWQRNQDNTEINGDAFGNISHFARWLIEQGRIKGE